MHLLWVLIFGLAVGVIARVIVPGREPGGWVMSIAIGILGSFVGGFLGRFLGIYAEGRPAGFVMSIIGAALLLVGYHAVARRRSFT